jgi:hypothetical protein
MSDGFIVFIKPQAEDAEVLLQRQAFWSINDVDGDRTTKMHSRGRRVLTPLTGAQCRLSCWPQGTPFDMKARTPTLAYEASFYSPASLAGNNIFTESLVRVPVDAAIAMWRSYMLARYGSDAMVKTALANVTSADCELHRVTVVYLWDCETPRDARKMHKRIFQHARAILDKDSRRSYWTEGGEQRAINGVERVRTDAQYGDTFYITLPWGQARVYIKTQHSAKSFCAISDEEVAQQLFERAERVVRFEVDIVVRRFAFGHKGQERFPLNPTKWNSTDMPFDPYEVIWNEVRRELRIDDSLAKHPPKRDKVAKLPDDHVSLMAMHMKGFTDLDTIIPDSKRRSRIVKRLDKADFRIDCHLPWEVQRRETWSSWLSSRMTYEQRLRPREHALMAIHSLTGDNVIDLTRAFIAKAASDPVAQPA